jgi:hypothetical protein
MSLPLARSTFPFSFEDFENLAETLATFVTLACIQLAIRRLARLLPLRQALTVHVLRSLRLLPLRGFSNSTSAASRLLLRQEPTDALLNRLPWAATLIPAAGDDLLSV